MKIRLNSVMVNDQARALEFYTGVLGFAKKNDIPVGAFRWLTVVSPDEPDGCELVLEPNANPAGRQFQQAIHAQGVAATAFLVDDIQSEFRRLTGLGVEFRTPPTQMGPTTIAVFDDTCGNLIQIYQL